MKDNQKLTVLVAIISLRLIFLMYLRIFDWHKVIFNKRINDI